MKSLAVGLMIAIEIGTESLGSGKSCRDDSSGDFILWRGIERQ